MRVSLAFVLGTSVWGSSLAFALTNPIRTDSGLVSGTVGEISVFKGIPYAAPPLGELRWMPPQSAAKWREPRVATEWGSTCVQPQNMLIPQNANRAEDCLTVNIWTPAQSSRERRPVMVWIYGGAFLIGTSAVQAYDGSSFARQGAIFVSFNYRLGPFGFLDHPELPNNQRNVGLLDQIAALRWVQRNIRAFGGDPSNVTVFGESAGARSLMYLIASPKAKGLFQRAIIQSGGFYPSVTGSRKAALEGMEPRTLPSLGRLRAMTAEEVLTLLVKRSPAWGPIPVCRHCEPALAAAWKETLDRMEAATLNRVDLIIGQNADEAATMLMNQIKDPAELRQYLLDVYNPQPEDAERLLQTYAIVEKTTPDAMAKRVFGEHLLTDNRLLAQTLAQRGAKTFLYVFTRVNSGGRMTRLGAFHGAEVPYVFGGITLGGTGTVMGVPVRYDENDARLGAAMNTSWYRFASAGDPNGGELPAWPAYNASHEAYLEFGDAIRARQDLPSATLDELWSIRRRAKTKLAAHR